MREAQHRYGALFFLKRTESSDLKNRVGRVMRERGGKTDGLEREKRDNGKKEEFKNRCLHRE